MKRLLKTLAGAVGATALATLLFGGSASVTRAEQGQTAPSFSPPTKRLVLDYSRVVLEKKGQPSYLGHGSHSSHSSHASHSSHRSHYSSR
jgi:hypothetical protein